MELEWCPRYLWLSKRHGVPVTPSMAAGRAREAELRRFLAKALGAEPKPVYIDAGWAHGVVDLLVRRIAASPVEVKNGVPRREHRWQLYAEAYLAKAAGYAVYAGYLAYGERIHKVQITKAELEAAEALLAKAAEVVEGPPPPPARSGKCSYCQYRAVCTYI